MKQTVFAMLFAVAACGSLAHAADPQPYRVVIASVGDGNIDATLKATSDLQSLRGTAPVSPFGLIARARSDVDRLKTALESFGYYESTVTIKINGMMVSNPGLGDVLSALSKGKDAQVAVTFNLGPLYHLGSIDIDGDLRGEMQYPVGIPVFAKQARQFFSVPDVELMKLQSHLGSLCARASLHQPASGLAPEEWEVCW